MSQRPVCRLSFRTIKPAPPRSFSSPIASVHRKSPRCRAKEAGYPDLTFEGSIGLFGWRDMPPYVRERIVRDVQAVAADPAFRSRLIAGGTVSRSGTSEEFAAAIAEQRQKIAAIHRAFAKPAQ
jgi:hypothetical protein